MRSGRGQSPERDAYALIAQGGEGQKGFDASVVESVAGDGEFEVLGCDVGAGDGCGGQVGEGQEGADCGQADQHPGFVRKGAGVFEGGGCRDVMGGPDGATDELAGDETDARTWQGAYREADQVLRKGVGFVE